MKKKSKVLSAFLLSASLVCTMPVYSSAAEINITETNISLDAIDSSWEEISDANTLHTFTNGTDKVTVMKYALTDTLPAPSKPTSQYEAVYQTYYSTKNAAYVVTGFAVKAENISNVRKIVESIAYPDNGTVPTLRETETAYGQYAASSRSESSENAESNVNGSETEYDASYAENSAGNPQNEEYDYEEYDYSENNAVLSETESYDGAYDEEEASDSSNMESEIAYGETSGMAVTE